MAERKSTQDFPDSGHTLPSDLKVSIESEQKVKNIWKELTPLARNEWICWVTSAKKEDTRVKRIKRLNEDLKAGKKRPCCWPGCPHRRPSAAKWFNSKTE